MARAILAAGVPTVELRSTKHTPGFPFIGMDNALIGQTVAEHFLNRGYRRFAAYTLDTEEFFRERVSKFVSRVKEAGSDCTLLPAQGESTPRDWESHQKRLMRWLESLEKPVGIFAANDQLAVRLLDACRRAAIAVPLALAARLVAVGGPVYDLRMMMTVQATGTSAAVSGVFRIRLITQHLGLLAGTLTAPMLLRELGVPATMLAMGMLLAAANALAWWAMRRGPKA
jgi:ABC-type sugar transport system substrate-binding protein